MLTAKAIDTTLYPFESRYLEIENEGFPDGKARMHYIDEGEGEIILFVHGTPVWSFLYRNLVKALSATHRCIAMDHIGFGLSDKPQGWGYKPEDHAANLEQFINKLGLKNINLMVHDFGGPIGLSYAVDHPANIKRLIIANTWMWSNADNKTVRKASNFFGSGFGKFLYLNMNFSPNVLLKQAYQDKKKLTKTIHRHYLMPFARKKDRYATWVLARELYGSNDFYDSIWQKRANIRQIPALLAWGMADKFITPDNLERLKTVFEQARELKLDAGHFIQEEAEDLPGHILSFLGS